MAHDCVQHVPVVQRIAETGNIGTPRHVAGLPVVFNQVNHFGQTKCVCDLQRATTRTDKRNSRVHTVHRYLNDKKSQ